MDAESPLEALWLTAVLAVSATVLTIGSIEGWKAPKLPRDCQPVADWALSGCRVGARTLTTFQPLMTVGRNPGVSESSSWIWQQRKTRRQAGEGLKHCLNHPTELSTFAHEFRVKCSTCTLPGQLLQAPARHGADTPES